MADEIYRHPRMAALYDPLDTDRSDLDMYRAVLDERDWASLLDVGSGTGVFALAEAARGKEVTAVEPAAASLAVARAKPGADAVTWVLGTAEDLPPLAVAAATMTANVAMVFADDGAWLATLGAVRAALAPGGRFVFDVRDVAARAWETWAEPPTEYDAAHEGTVVSSCDVEVDLPLVHYSDTTTFADGETIASRCTLRYRDADEIVADLRAAGFEQIEARDHPYRPGSGWLFVAS
ncbi:class I SAM-dependent methyltransferase [Propioniciclava coleopterorum]|uniref:Class I SAM-dependent methyltransferase n=1 Tax=Propioniciclava coleopterorum TaxID=2714937 RepID=A0A6G7Y5L5_9ACTN|nr:class I SAM-dependent methyltransferase [Propioniciclava coleopterorum]QIK71921.1 class I SAM-dependent methyltransferase [Propioniciclava coleopterorum]